MKRTGLILLTAIYIVSSLGMSVNRFYCFDKLTSVSVAYGAGDDAGVQSGKKDKCCGHEKQSFKVKDSHFSAATLALSHPSPLTVPSFIGISNKPVVSFSHTQILYSGNAPPGHSDIPVYTINCAYRI